MRKSQQGFSIISAIFLLVVLSVLGVAMTSFSTFQHQSAAMDVMGARAYQAASAGVEWAAFKVSLQAASSAVPWPECAAPPSVAVAGDLATFSPVTVNCSAVSSVEGASTIWIYDVSAVAQTTGSVAGNQDYVRRVVSARLAK